MLRFQWRQFPFGFTTAANSGRNSSRLSDTRLKDNSLKDSKLDSNCKTNSGN